VDADRRRGPPLRTSLAKELAGKNKSPGNYYLRISGVTSDKGHTIDGYAQHKDDAAADRHLTPANSEIILLPAFGEGDSFFPFIIDRESHKTLLLRFNPPL
jgi:hypothetical protein